MRTMHAMLLLTLVALLGLVPLLRSDAGQDVPRLDGQTLIVRGQAVPLPDPPPEPQDAASPPAAAGDASPEDACEACRPACASEAQARRPVRSVAALVGSRLRQVGRIAVAPLRRLRGR